MSVPDFEEVPEQKQGVQNLELAATHIRGVAEQMGWQAKEYGQSVEGIPLLAWWPKNKPQGIFFAAIHGEESQTILIAHQLMREVAAKDSHCVVIPVLTLTAFYMEPGKMLEVLT